LLYQANKIILTINEVVEVVPQSGNSYIEIRRVASFSCCDGSCFINPYNILHGQYTTPQEHRIEGGNVINSQYFGFVYNCWWNHTTDGQHAAYWGVYSGLNYYLSANHYYQLPYGESINYLDNVTLPYETTISIDYGSQTFTP
jgi:hypothetical protein